MLLLLKFVSHIFKESEFGNIFLRAKNKQVLPKNQFSKQGSLINPMINVPIRPNVHTTYIYFCKNRADQKEK